MQFDFEQKGADVNEEQRRRECEARFVLAMQSKSERQDYLALVLKKRGLQAMEMLKSDILKEHRK